MRFFLCFAILLLLLGFLNAAKLEKQKTLAKTVANNVIQAKSPTATAQKLPVHPRSLASRPDVQPVVLANTLANGAKNTKVGTSPVATASQVRQIVTIAVAKQQSPSINDDGTDGDDDDSDDDEDAKAIHSIDQLCSVQIVDKYSAKHDARMHKWRDVFAKVVAALENVHNQLEDWKLDIQVFAEWLTRTEHVETLVQVLIVMGSMRVPICFTLDTLQKVKGSDPILKEIHRLDDADDSKAGIRTYMFGRKGLVPLLLTDTDEALECATSLEAQTEVGELLQQTIEALAKHTNMKSFKTMISSIVSEFSGSKSGIREMIVKEWEKQSAKLTAQNIAQDVEKFAIWLIAPTHIEFAIKVILYVTGLNGPVSLSLNILAAFGLDDLLVTYMEKAGAKIIHKGAKRQLVMWAFGPNGVVALFLRKSNLSTDQMPVYEDHNGQLYTKAELDKIYHTLEDEGTFLKHIMEEIIRHQGHPFHELMDHVVADFTKMGDKLERGMQRMAQKMHDEWHKIKQLQLNDVEAGLKSVVMFLITPEHVNKMLKVVLSLTGVDNVVYLTLEVMEALHITDYIEKGLLATDKALHDWEFIKNHRHVIGAVDFMIGEDGLVPLFLKDGALSDYDRAARTTDEAALVGTVIEAVADNETPIAIAAAAWSFVVKKFTANFSTLKLLQKWNNAQSSLNANMEQWYEELSELKKQKLAQQKAAVEAQAAQASGIEQQKAANTMNAVDANAKANDGNNNNNNNNSRSKTNATQKQQQSPTTSAAAQKFLPNNNEQDWLHRWNTFWRLSEPAYRMATLSLV